MFYRKQKEKRLLLVFQEIRNNSKHDYIPCIDNFGLVYDTILLWTYKMYDILQKK